MKHHRHYLLFICLVALFVCGSIPGQIAPKPKPEYQLQANDITPVEEWVTFIGTDKWDVFSSSAIDSNGNIFVLTHSYLRDDDTTNTINDPQIILTKITDSGQIEWETVIEAGPYNTSGSLDLDNDGNIYITGKSSEPWGKPINPFNQSYFLNNFIAKYNNNGTLLWNTFIGSQPDNRSPIVAWDESQNVYIAWGENNITNYFLAKLNNEGALQWARSFGLRFQPLADEYLGKVNDIKLDNYGNIFVLSDSNTGWGNPTREPSGGRDSSLAKFDNNGELIWNTFLGGPGNDDNRSLEIDENGNIYVSGHSETTWGDPLSLHNITDDGSVVKLDPDGNILWNTFIGSETGSDGINDFKIGANGTLYLTGGSTSTWGNPFKTFAGNRDIFIAQMDSSGSFLWNTFLGSSDFAFGFITSLEIDNNNNLFILGTSDTGFGNPINNPIGGGSDVSIAKISLLVEESQTSYRDSGPLVPKITTYIPTPLDLSIDPSVIGTNVFFAVVLMLPFAVAVDYFSKLFSDNEEKIKSWIPPIAWIGILQNKSKEHIAKGTKQNQRILDALSLFGVAFFYGIVFSLLDETWNPLTAQGLVLLSSMTFAYGIIGILDDILQWRAIRKWGIPSEYEVRPTNVFLSAVSVGISRILSLLPGLMFGSPEAINVDEKILNKSQNQSLIRISTWTYLGIAFGAWLPTIGTAILQQSQIPDSTKNYLGGLEAFLLVIFAVALENIFIQLLGFSEGLGAKLKRSNRWRWGISLVLCSAFFLHTLLNPHYDLVESLKQGNTVVFIGVALIFIIIMIIIWLITWRNEGKKIKS